jgi:hypothetical protein
MGSFFGHARNVHKHGSCASAGHVEEGDMSVEKGTSNTPEPVGEHSSTVGQNLLKLFTKNLIIAILIGIIFLLLSYSLFELPYADSGAPLPASPLYRFSHTFFHEIGFALVVASTIWMAFEFFSHQDANDHWNQRLENIAKSVFRGVYRRNLPEAYINEATDLTIEHQFLRTGLNVTYTIIDACCQFRNGESKRFVKLSAVARYKIWNVDSAVAKCPIGILLPNPLIDEMKAHCRVNKISVKKGGKDVPISLDKAEARFRDAIKDDNKFQVPFMVEPQDLRPGQEMEVIFDYVMAKEEEDTEIFQTKYPTDSLNLVIVDKGPTRRLVRARSIHLADLDNNTAAESQGTYSYRLDRFLIPHQGFAIWWKNIPDAPAPLTDDKIS